MAPAETYLGTSPGPEGALGSLEVLGELGEGHGHRGSWGWVKSLHQTTAWIWAQVMHKALAKKWKILGLSLARFSIFPAVWVRIIHHGHLGVYLYGTGGTPAPMQVGFAEDK